MAKPIEPDQILLKMPSLRAVKSFVAAAKYLNFTRAAEALCVTQAAISRQIRELEVALGVPLFKRTGRAVELTEAGQIFYDAAYLSFVNIAQAAQRIQSSANKKRN
ncbi:LysR family transcriptional regulator [Marinomonas pontica]|uniref:LysR family transcriptional regulator n=1 Tax=Marinomonas pontica TaxID=264739 RepID=UPI002243C4FB|nr:LysR family transcriptional regulator [Marinomonas pontica]MCW8355578.1 LysR family transcriptional regulator [Marinomonas pontica]